MSFVETVRATKGIKARNLIPSCDSIPDLEALLEVETRVLITGAARSRLNALLKAAAKAAEGQLVLGLEPEKPADPVEPEQVEEVESKTCPKCGETGPIAEMFGLRNTKRIRADGTEVVTSRAQSYCKACRNTKRRKKE